LLRERQSDSGPSPVESGDRAPSARPVQEPQDADVQRIRRSGGRTVHRHGPPKELLALVISNYTIRWVLKPAVFLAALGPFAWLLWAARTGAFSADPLADITNETGIWTLRFLCLTLSVTPVRRLTGWNAVIRFRRLLGLFAFFYGTLHFLTYIVFD